MTSTTNEGDPEIGGGSCDNSNANNSSVNRANHAKNKTIANALAKSQCPILGQSLQSPAGLLFKKDSINLGRQQKACELDELLPKDSGNLTEVVTPTMTSEFFIPQVKLHKGDGSERKRVLVLCTGGTLTMAPHPDKDHALAPVPGALTDYLKSMVELTNENMPDVVVHEYCPLLDSSDMGKRFVQ